MCQHWHWCCGYLLLSTEQKCKQINKLALFTAPCGWEIRQTYNSDRIPKQLTEVFCLDSGSSCDANPRYQVKSFSQMNINAFRQIIYSTIKNFDLCFSVCANDVSHGSCLHFALWKWNIPQAKYYSGDRLQLYVSRNEIHNLRFVISHSCRVKIWIQYFLYVSCDNKKAYTMGIL